MMEIAKVFWSGRSQAVRLPKEFRVEGDEVRIRRHGAAVILEPIATDWARSAVRSMLTFSRQLPKNHRHRTDRDWMRCSVADALPA